METNVHQARKPSTAPFEDLAFAVLCVERAGNDHVIRLLASECKNILEHSFAGNCDTFADLRIPGVSIVDQNAEWLNLFQRFEAELLARDAQLPLLWSG